VAVRPAGALRPGAPGRPARQRRGGRGPRRPAAARAQVGNSWRTTQDISLNITASWAGILENLDGNTGLARFAEPGGWNDADMLEARALP